MKRQFSQTDISQVFDRQTLLTLGLAVFCVLVGLLSIKVDPRFIIVAIVALPIMYMAIRFEFFGLILYFVVFMIRPGEMYPALAAIKIEFVVGGAVAIATVLKNKNLYGKITLPRSNLNLDFILFLGAIGISFFLSSCKDCTIFRFQEMAKLGVFYLLIILTVDSRKRLEIFFWIFIVLNARIAFETAKNYYTGQAVFNQGLMRAVGDKSTTIADNFNGIAITLNSAFPFAYYLFLHYKSYWKKAILGIFMALFGLTVILTGSRGGLLGFVAILGFIWWQSKHKLPGIFILVLVLIMGWFGLGEQSKQRYSTIFDSELDSSSQGRVAAWKDGIQLFLERPLTGVGAGAFLQARVDRFGVYLDPHNLYVHVFAELGIIGGFIFFFMFLKDIFRINLKIIREIQARGSPNALLVPFSKGILIACVSLLVTGIFAHSTYRYTWYLFAALTVTSEQFLRKTRAESPVPEIELEIKQP
jgi:probable O-glycosylation ligase (exosortase A-associated)